MVPFSDEVSPAGKALAWPEARPCVARRAKRLGRSGGPSQRRARRSGGGSLLYLRAGRPMPGMICQRRPFSLLYRNRHTGAPGQRKGVSCSLQVCRTSLKVCKILQLVPSGRASSLARSLAYLFAVIATAYAPVWIGPSGMRSPDPRLR